RCSSRSPSASPSWRSWQPWRVASTTSGGIAGLSSSAMNDNTVPLLADAFPEVRPLGDALRASHRTVAVAESCTGGLLGAALTAFPGSSDFLLGGVIAYADHAKVAPLGVTREALAADGAVSEEVATQMADGARLIFGADIGLAITGVAGAGGGRRGRAPRH